MSIVEDLIRLERLRESSGLSDEEFQLAKGKLLRGQSPGGQALQTVNGFRRSGSDRWLGGVCGGLALASGVEAWIWRLGFALSFCSGFGILAYLALWFFVPLEGSATVLEA